MGKVKSAIITSLLVAALLVLALFATISCNVPGTNNVKRYNSFLSGIHLGSDLTGEAYALLYPKGVISVTDYYLVVNDDDNENKGDYIDKYVSRNGVFVEKDKAEDEEFAKSVLSDAKIISDRLNQKGYAGYSVTVEDGFVIKMTMPTNFTWAAFREHDAASRSEELNRISNVVQLFMMDGTVSLRDNAEYESSKSLISIREDFASFFTGVRYYAMGGNTAVQLDLTDDGFTKLNSVVTALESSTNAYIYVGENNLGLQLTGGTALESKTLYFSATENNAQNFAILLDSVVNDNVLVNSYNDDTANSGTELIVATPAYGEYAAVCVLVALILVLLAAIIYPIIKYKKLGLVNALIAITYSLVMIVSLLLLEIQLTVGGAVFVALGLALLTFTNVRVFESVRTETMTGRTIQASVKDGYKKRIFEVLDLHVILLIASIIVALVCVGELAACGFIFFIATIASYVLHWFTRFMWFVISSPVKDKFKFCGFAREVLDDEV